MAKTLRIKKQYPEDFKTLFGLSTMNWTDTISGSFMTGLFMMYLTDYAGIGMYAASLGTFLLTFGRLVDAIDDPVQGYIMDRAKPGKYGKYKPFIIISTILVTVALCFMFSIPTAVAQSPVLVTVWVIIFYLMYDIGISFFAENPLKQSLTTDPVLRSRFATWPRVISMLVVIPMSFFIAILAGINNRVGDMHKSFSLLSVIFLLTAGVFSLLGIILVKEGKHVEAEAETNVTFKDFFAMLIKNKPMIISTLVSIFHGFVWTLVFATTTYYVKWAYCTDLSTGLVDADRFATLTMVMGMFQLFPSLLAAAISPKLVKTFKGPVKVYRLSMYLELAGGLAMYICMQLGLLQTSPAVFFVLIFFILFGGGLSFVPGTLVGIESMDYGMYITGKEMHGMSNAFGAFIRKAQTALSSALVGAVLIAIGYQVDSVTDAFVGELSAIPRMLRSFIVISGLVPAVLCVISLVLLRFYPITNEVRDKMNAAINKLKEN